LRPTSRADLDSLLDLLGDEDETSDLLFEGEMERRKDSASISLLLSTVKWS